jgi:hypothetical protein
LFIGVSVIFLVGLFESIFEQKKFKLKKLFFSFFLDCSLFLIKVMKRMFKLKFREKNNNQEKLYLDERM